MKELKDQLKSKIYDKVYLFSGEDYLKDIYETRFKNAIVSKDFFDMNFNIFEGKVELGQISDLADTTPFMDMYRLIVIKKSGLFSGKNEEILEFIDDIKKMPESTVLMFIENTVDKRTKAYKEISKLGTAVDFTPLKEEELIDWVIDKFKKNNKKITSFNASYFLRQVATDMYSIENEADKLLNYVEAEAFKEDIDEVVTVSVEAKIFDMTKAIGDKNIKTAILIYNQLIATKTEPLMILVMIARQFRLILRVKALKDRREEDIAKLLEVKPFVVRECLKQSHKFKYNTLISALEDCLQTDMNIKTGKVEGKLGVEMVIFRYGG